MGFDTIIIARGGGSIEDLWCFNDESVARFVALMNTPTISAIGHETDFTILDFVADIRAATPTAAAEIATPNYLEVFTLVSSQNMRMKNSLKNRISNYSDFIQNIKKRNWYTNPEMLFVNKHMICNSYLHKLNQLSQNNLSYLRKQIDKNQLKLGNVLMNNINSKKNEFTHKLIKLDALSPLKVMSRGYGIVENEKGIIKTIKDVSINEEVKVKLVDGSIKAKVIFKEEK